MQVEPRNHVDALVETIRHGQEAQTNLAEKLVKIQVETLIELTALETMGNLVDERV